MGEINLDCISIACEDICDDYLKEYIAGDPSAAYTAVEVRNMLEEYFRDLFRPDGVLPGY